MVTKREDTRRFCQFELRSLFSLMTALALYLVIFHQPTAVAIPLAIWVALGWAWFHFRLFRPFRLLVLPAVASAAIIALLTRLDGETYKGQELFTRDETVFGGAVPGAILGIIASSAAFYLQRRRHHSR